MNGSKKTDGFSLLEVVIAMAVLSIGLLAFIGMFGAGYQALKSGNNRTLATQLARDKMEALRATAPSLINDEDLAEGMTRKWWVQKDAGDPGIWIISVEVCWKDCAEEGTKRAVSFKSFRAS